MLLEKIKVERLQARKDKDEIKSSLLSTLLGEIELELKRSSETNQDNIVRSVALKFSKNIKLTLEKIKSSDKLNRELEILETYLPRSLNEDEIKTILIKLVNKHGKDMRVIMQSIKDIIGMDMKLASQILKSL